jgi:hypothetical protein
MESYELHCPRCGHLTRVGAGGGPCQACGAVIVLPTRSRRWLQVAVVVLVAGVAGSAAAYYKLGRIRDRTGYWRQQEEQARQLEAGKAAQEQAAVRLEQARKSTEAARQDMQARIERLKELRPATSPAGTPTD